MQVRSRRLCPGALTALTQLRTTRASARSGSVALTTVSSPPACAGGRVAEASSARCSAAFRRSVSRAHSLLVSSVATLASARSRCACSSAVCAACSCSLLLLPGSAADAVPAEDPCTSAAEMLGGFRAAAAWASSSRTRRSCNSALACAAHNSSLSAPLAASSLAALLARAQLRSISETSSCSYRSLLDLASTRDSSRW